MAEIALLVDVGSFSDPTRYQGMARLLERMMFMGSEKYPTETALYTHFEKCDGSYSSQTRNDITLFCMNVPEKHLESCMDYFTASFKAPLLLTAAMVQAREEIETEFQENSHDYELRRTRILTSLANKEYPHFKFCWGNFKSLKEDVNDDDLHKNLLEFFKRHYSAHRMHMVVKAGLPLEELEHLVVKYFSEIHSNNQDGMDFSVYNYREAFRPEFHNEVLFVKPEQNVCKLVLTWLMPNHLKAYKYKAVQFVVYLLQSDFEGSLGDYLKKRLWSFDMTVGLQESDVQKTSIYNLLTLTINLTDSGFKHLDEVLSATSAYIKLISPCGALKVAHDEFTRLIAGTLKIQSIFNTAEEMVIRCIGIYHPVKHMFTSASFVEYDEELIQDVIRHLNEFTFNITITSKQKYSDDITYDKMEKWFGTEYTSIKMPQKWKDLWKNCQQVPEFQLPKPNPFFANDFHLFWVDSKKTEIPLSPKKLLQNDTCELWFRQGNKLNCPMVASGFIFVTPLLGQSAKNAVMNSLYSELLADQLKEQLVLAESAGLSFTTRSFHNGMAWVAGGFHDKYHLVMDVMANNFVSLREHITEAKLDACKTKLKKDTFKDLINPEKLREDIYESILVEPHWTLIEKYKCFDDISLDDMLEFAEKYTQELYIQAIIQDNYTEELSLNVMNSVLNILKPKKIQEPKYTKRRYVQLPQGSHYIRCNALNEKDVNTTVLNLYQCGPTYDRLESILDLYTSLIEHPTFDTLRTEELLGDSVKSTMFCSSGIAFYYIAVTSQESKAPASQLDDRIESFRGKMLHILEGMPEDEFIKVRESVIKAAIDHWMDHEFTRNLYEIIEDQYRFDRDTKRVEILKALKKQDIIEFFENEKNTMRKLSTQIIGNVSNSSCVLAEEKPVGESIAEDEGDCNNVEEVQSGNSDLFNDLANKLDLQFIPCEGDATTIVDIHDFKKNLYVYPITKSE